MLMIELKHEDPQEPLGFTVAGYRTADSRYIVNIIVFIFIPCSIDVLCALSLMCMCVGPKEFILYEVVCLSYIDVVTAVDPSAQKSK